MSYDLSDTHALIRAGEDLGITPYPSEESETFALRVAHAHNDRERQRRLRLGLRLGLSAALIAFGIGGF